MYKKGVQVLVRTEPGKGTNKIKRTFFSWSPFSLSVSLLGAIDALDKEIKRQRMINHQLKAESQS